jgi:NhaP-type Na+/H+ or K+/H+ antiporter
MLNFPPLSVSFLTSASFAIALFRILEAALAFDFAVCFVATDRVLIGGVRENSLSTIVELCQGDDHSKQGI